MEKKRIRIYWNRGIGMLFDITDFKKELTRTDCYVYCKAWNPITGGREPHIDFYTGMAIFHPPTRMEKRYN